jgi:hypothetical protein
MLYAATWSVKLARAGTVLLDWADYMDIEPSIVPTGETQRVKAVRAPYSLPIGRGNVSTVVTFSQVRVFESAALAHKFLAQWVAALPLCKAPDTLEITFLNAGGDLATLANAVLTSAGKPTVTEGNRFRATYTVEGGLLSYATAEPVLENTDGSPLENTDGSPIENTH